VSTKTDSADSSARVTPLPSASQLEEVFDGLPDEPKGPIKKTGPQYKPRSSPPFGSILGALRNGDRALIVAVNDSGNTGWVRFGRTGFASEAIM
jgi:tRNA-splicing endonuclease subunit Sen54